MLPKEILKQDGQRGRMSRKLSRCCKRVNAAAKAGAYINDTQLYDMFADLTDAERGALADYIVKAYYPFDVERVMELYDDWQQVVDAMHSTAGSEYDLAEKWYSNSDLIYTAMSSYISEKLNVWPVRNVVQLPFDQKMLLASELKLRTGATDYEVNKFLHLRSLRT